MTNKEERIKNVKEFFYKETQGKKYMFSMEAYSILHIEEFYFKETQTQTHKTKDFIDEVLNSDRSTLYMLTRKLATYINTYEFYKNPSEDKLVSENLNRFLYTAPIECCAIFYTFCNCHFWKNCDTGEISLKKRKNMMRHKNLYSIWRYYYDQLNSDHIYPVGSLFFILNKAKKECFDENNKLVIK